MPLTAIADCTTPLESAKLLYAGDYMGLVSSGVSGLGAVNVSWPPGPRPEPYKWTSNRGETYTLVLLDGAWRYKNSRTGMFISPSNLYDIIGVPKDVNTGASGTGLGDRWWHRRLFPGEEV